MSYITYRTQIESWREEFSHSNTHYGQLQQIIESINNAILRTGKPMRIVSMVTAADHGFVLLVEVPD